MNRMIRMTLGLVVIGMVLSLGVAVVGAQTGSGRFPQLNKDALTRSSSA